MPMLCTKCNTNNPDGAKFCMGCGDALGQVCPNCGASLPAEAQFCFVCGHRIGAEVPDPTRAEAARIEQYIPPELLTKLQSARDRGGMQGERRVVTMLFCDVKGSTASAEQLDPEDWAGIMNGAFEHLISPVYAYEGTLARLMGDAILAFFGAPIAHEDDPQRAVLAGLAILRAIEPYRERMRREWDIDFDVRVGINTGLVVVGEVGSDLRVEYTALGDAVNLAARMEQTAAPGTVQISEQTHRLIAPLFEFEELGGVEVKGKAAPVNAYRVLQPKEEPGQVRGIQGMRSPLIGRSQEVEQLREAAADLRRGRGQIVSLMGDAGLGKSRIMAEMRQEVVAEGDIAWFEGRALSYQTSTPYAPFAGLFTSMLGIPRGASDAERYEALTRALGFLLPAGSGNIAPYLATVLGIEVEGDDRELTRFTEPQELRERVFGAAAEVIATLSSGTPMVLVFEDLHWADPTSVELIEHLMPLTDSTMLLLLGAFRPNRSDPSWRFHETAERDYDHRYTPIALKPLDPDETNSMVDNLLQASDLPSHVRSLVLAKTEGNPFFVEEVIRSLLESGALVREGDRLRAATEIDDISVPDTLAGVLTARLDQLDESSKHVAQSASVIGREFNVDLLAQIETSGSDLDATLHVLQRRGLVRETTRVPRRVFAFKHSLTQDAAYGSLLLSRRRELHRQVADWLEAEEPERVADIGRHLLEAREPARALPYVVVAGDEAARAYAMREAIGWYRRAVDVIDAAETPGLARQAFEGLGAALQFTSDLAAALETYEQMERKARELDDQPMLVSALNKQAFVLGVRMGDNAGAIEHLERAEEVATAAHENPGLAELNMIHCFIRTSTGDLDGAYDRLQTAAAIGRELDLVEPKLFGMVHVANTLNYMTRFREAEQAANEALDVAREAGHLGWEAELLSLTVPFYKIAGGDLEGALESAQAGTSLAVRIGSADRECYGAFLQGMLQRLKGRYEAAIAADEQSVRAARVSKATFIEAAALCELGSAYSDISPALSERTGRLHVESLEALDRPLGMALGGIVWANIGFCALGMGELDQAEAMFRKGLDFRTGMYLVARPQLLLGLGFVALTRGNADEAARHIAAARAFAEEHEMRHYDPFIEMADGMLHGGTGQPEVALAHLETATARAEAMGMTPVVWQAQAGMAGILRALGREAEAEEVRRKARATVDAMAADFADGQLRDHFVRQAGQKL